MSKTNSKEETENDVLDRIILDTNQTLVGNDLSDDPCKSLLLRCKQTCPGYGDKNFCVKMVNVCLFKIFELSILINDIDVKYNCVLKQNKNWNFLMYEQEKVVLMSDVGEGGKIPCNLFFIIQSKKRMDVNILDENFSINILQKGENLATIPKSMFLKIKLQGIIGLPKELEQ